MLDIAFSFDAQVLDGTAALLASIARSCSSSRVTLHGLYPDAERLKVARIELLARRLGLTLLLNTFDDGLLENFPDLPTLPRAAFRRLFHPAILRDRCDRYLYLDTDVLVLDDPTAIVASCDDRFTISAVRDLGVRNLKEGLSFVENNGIYNDLSPYFNSGVMIVSVRRWLEHNYTQKIIDFTARYGSHFRFGDQDAINFVLQNDIGELEMRWNVQVGPLDYQRRLSGKPKPSRAELRKVAAESGILHFAGGGKPWTRKWYVHHRGLYYDLLIRSGWLTTQAALKQRASNKLLGGWDSLRSLLANRICKGAN